MRRLFFIASFVLPLLPGCSALEAASSLGGLVVENFRIAPEKYPAPNERQNKYMLEGARAQPLGTGSFVLAEARLRTYKPTGATEMEVVTASCTYDQPSRSVQSAAPVRLHTMDGKFSISGVGFFWGETNSILVISNAVETLIAPELFQPEEPGAARRASSPGPLKIQARHFEYNAATGYGRYSGQVRVTGTNNLSLNAEFLNLVVPGMTDLANPVHPGLKVHPGDETSPAPRPKVQLRSLEAEMDVMLKYGEVNARGQRCVYSADAESLEVTGQPSWTMGEREGSADAIRIDRNQRLFLSEGHAVLRLPFQGEGFPGFSAMAGQPVPKGGAPNQTLKITCQNYVIGTNSADFSGDVLAREVSGAGKGGQLTCQHLTLGFVNTNELTSLLAVGGVVVSQDDREFSAGRLDYDARSRLARFNENPAWKDGSRSGSGRVILVHALDEELEVRGDATLSFPAEQLAPVGAGFVGTNRPPGVPGAMASIEARQYRISRSLALFEGGAKVRHPRMQLEAERVSMFRESGQDTVHKVVAEPKVGFRLTDPQGQQIQGTGDQAIYSRRIVGGKTNAIVELTGSPAKLNVGNGVAVENRLLLLDLENGKFVVPPGGYRITGPTNFFGTNLFRRNSLAPR